MLLVGAVVVLVVAVLLGGAVARRGRGRPDVPGHLPLPPTGRSEAPTGVSDVQHHQDWWEGGKRLPGQKF